MSHLKARVLALIMILVCAGLVYYNWQQLLQEGRYSLKLGSLWTSRSGCRILSALVSRPRRQTDQYEGTSAGSAGVCRGTGCRFGQLVFDGSGIFRSQVKQAQRLNWVTTGASTG